MHAPRLSLHAHLAAIAFLAATSAEAQSAWAKPNTPPPKHEVQAPAVEKNLKVFDVLDFDVFSGQKWERIAESHDKDIVVTWPGPALGWPQITLTYGPTAASQPGRRLSSPG